MIDAWDKKAAEFADKFDTYDLDYEQLKQAFIDALRFAYSKGCADGERNEQRNPHREDMGK